MGGMRKRVKPMCSDSIGPQPFVWKRLRSSWLVERVSEEILSRYRRAMFRVRSSNEPLVTPRLACGDARDLAARRARRGRGGSCAGRHVVAGRSSSQPDAASGRAALRLGQAPDPHARPLLGGFGKRARSAAPRRSGKCAPGFPFAREGSTSQRRPDRGSRRRCRCSGCGDLATVPGSRRVRESPRRSTGCLRAPTVPCSALQSLAPGIAQGGPIRPYSNG